MESTDDIICDALLAISEGPAILKMTKSYVSAICDWNDAQSRLDSLDAEMQ